MANTLAAFDYLAHAKRHPAAGVCAVFGDEPFLRRLAINELRQQVLGDRDAEFSLTRFEGATVEMRDVLDELSTIALFGGGQRLVLIDNADDFVSKNRLALENYVARPRSSSVLVLDVSAWPKNTKLYKALDARGLQIDCKTPDGRSLPKWLIGLAQKRHEATLNSAAAEALVEIVGPELGLLDQELAKLAVCAEPGKPITDKLVHELVGGWRAKTAWIMIDAALGGNARQAMTLLNQLLLGGEHPIAVLAQIASKLRHFAAAVRIIELAESKRYRISARNALEQAGVKPFELSKAEEQLKKLGSQRATRLYRWLLQADLDLKGGSKLPPRTVMERLIVRIAAPQSSATVSKS